MPYFPQDNVTTLTQAQYDAITPLPGHVYVIVPAA